MRAPTLRQVGADLERIGDLAPKLAEAARWAWPMAYSPTRGHGERVAGGSVATPVEAAITSAAAGAVRDEVGRAGLLIGQAHAHLLGAAACLARARANAAGVAEAIPPESP